MCYFYVVFFTQSMSKVLDIPRVVLLNYFACTKRTYAMSKQTNR